jgi:transmembrane sensor
MTDERSSDAELFSGWEEGDQREIQQTLALFQTDALGAGRFDRDAHWARVATAIRANRPATSQHTDRKVQRSWRTIVLGVGAGVVSAGVVIGVFANRGVQQTRTRVYHTAAGQQSTVDLSNGTRMRLGPSTTATVTPSGISLQGQALFTVAGKSARPLIVTTDNAVARVLGTRFSVRQYPSERMSRVFVEEGRVSLISRTARATLSQRVVVAERMLGLVTDSGTTVRTGVVAQEETGWTRGMLVFNRVPLRDVVAELSRAYGVAIQIADPALATEPVIAEVSVRDRSVTQILDAISFMLNAKYVRKDSSFVLSQGPRRPQRATDVPEKDRILHEEKLYGR